MKQVYIIPGYMEHVSQKRYRPLKRLLVSKGYQVIPVKIEWKRRVIEDWIEDFMRQCKHQEAYWIGFSYGSMIALAVSTKMKPELQVLCSLSPYFKEDLPTIQDKWKQGIGKKRVESFSDFSFDDLAKSVRCTTILAVGTEEKRTFQRAKDAHRKIKGSELYVVEGGRHDIGQKEYVEVLEKIIETRF